MHQRSVPVEDEIKGDGSIFPALCWPAGLSGAASQKKGEEQNRSVPFLSLLVANSLGDGIQDVAEVEAAGRLTRREVLEALQPLGDNVTNWRDHEDALQRPFFVADAFVPGTLEGIAAQVHEHGHAHGREWIAPNVNHVRLHYKREGLGIEVAFSLPAGRVIRCPS